MIFGDAEAMLDMEPGDDLRILLEIVNHHGSAWSKVHVPPLAFNVVFQAEPANEDRLRARFEATGFKLPVASVIRL